MVPWFQHGIADTGRLRLFCFFVAFICAFLFIRLSVRMIRARVRWWPGNVTPGGRHIHHVVFGLVFMCVGGVAGLGVQDTGSGWAAATAALFGTGTALVLDEFALVLHLQDVYWSEQGRLSVSVVFFAIAVTALALLGITPLGLGEPGGPGGERTPAGVAVYLLASLAFSVVCLLKGKTWCGLLGLFVGVLALVGAIRLARPSSPWARRRYGAGSRKLARAMRREERFRGPLDRAARWFQDLVAGRPDGRG